VAVLHNEVLPFYRNLGLPVRAVLTDNGREFCGTERHPYELYLALNEIEHRTTRVGSPKTNGFVERFNGTVLQEFFRPACTASSTKASRSCRPTSTPGCTTTPRPAPPRLPQPGPPAVGHDRAIRQTRRLRGHMIEGFGWIYLVVVLDWHTKKVVGHYAGLQARAWHWLVL
jgi:transposase InsO family protein